MRDVMRITASLVFVLGVVLLAACGPASQHVERSVAKKLVTAGSAKAAQSKAILNRDLRRDLATRVTRLKASRTVFRYMSGAEAKAVRARGIAAARHFTATGGRGRPLSGANAAKRYGLPVVPSHRASVRLPAGTKVKANKVIGGGRGEAELKVIGAVPRNQVKGPSRLAR